MKKIVLSISIFCISLGLSAQDLSSKIPADAAAVITIKGERLTNLVSVKDFTTSKLGQMLGKELSRESDGKVASIEAAGFDLEKNFYYFLEVNEGVYTNCFLIPLKDVQGFKNLLSTSEKERIQTTNGLSYFQDEYDGVTTLWSDNALILMFAKDQNESSSYDYYDDYGLYDQNFPPIEETTEAASDAVAAAVEDSIEDAATEVTVLEVGEESIEATEVEEAIEETVVESTDSYNDYYNSEEYKRQQAIREENRIKREAEREIERKALAEATLKKAMEVMAGNYSQGTILKNPSYLKSIGNGSEEASAWVADFGKIYQDAMSAGSLIYGAANPYSFMDINKFYGGMSITAKLDFEEDHAAIKTVYTMNDEMAGLYEQMYDGKLNTNFAKYVNEDRMLGYWSLNMSTEGILNAYPDMMDNLVSTKDSNTYGDAISLGAYLFSVLIDEEAAAEIIRGDMMLVLNDLSERTVTYIDYEYDEEYNTKEVEKTKTETVPDFMFMFSSEQKELFNRLVRIGLNEGELEAMNGMYKFTTMGKSSPFDLYVMFKDDICFMGSSKRDMMAINTGTYVSKLTGDHKKNMKKNASSMYVNGKKIIAQIPIESYPSDLRDKIGFLTQNTEDVQFRFEKIKGNTMKGEMIWNTATTGHNNSFDYFLNMIEALVD